MTIKAQQYKVGEDWTSVLFGFLTIFVFLLGLKLPNPNFTWSNADELFNAVLKMENLINILILFFPVYLVSLMGSLLLNKDVKPIAKGFPIVYFLTMLALILAGNSFLKSINLEAVIISLSLGLVLSNIFDIPKWLRDSLSTELFVKIGLVLLGTTVIFGDILKAGSLGLVQALLVVLSVWYFAFWLSKKMGIDEEMSLMISSAVSICGVSAAIATSGAIKGDSKKLSYVISLVLITAIPMIMFMPFIAKAIGLSEAVTGAWLGGTIDTTGAVIASGSLVGEVALQTSTIVKFSQNVLLGLAAFAISIYWTYTNNQSDVAQQTKPSLGLIWDRFPKFVIGFMAASLLFSFILSAEQINEVKGGLKSIQGLWFALAFTSIGLETKFSDLFNSEGRKPMYAFLIAQVFNIFITLIIAYFLFK